MRLIKLAVKSEKHELYRTRYISLDHIEYIGSHSPTENFIGFDDGELTTKETPDEIIELIKKAEEI